VRDELVFREGSVRQNLRCQELCDTGGSKPRRNVETGKEEPWLLKDLRKTCATYYDAHVPESSIEILGHSVGGITDRHYAHRAPLAFKAILPPVAPTTAAPIRALDLGKYKSAACVYAGDAAASRFESRTKTNAANERLARHLGQQEWQRTLARTMSVLQRAFTVDYVMLRGGNAKNVRPLAEGVRLGDNENAFQGSFRLWET